MRDIEYFLIYTLGALLYCGIEMLWRGRTHWSMALCGGACFELMYIVSASSMALPIQLLLCAIGISVLEFFTGWVVNLRLGLKVWDYSDMPLNLRGQICPAFSLIWLALSVPGLALCQKLRMFFYQ